MIESMPDRETWRDTKRARMHQERESERVRRTSISNQSSNLWRLGEVLCCSAESLMIVESLRERERERVRERQIVRAANE